MFNATVFFFVVFTFYSLPFHKEKGKVLDLTTITNMLYFLGFQLCFKMDFFRNIQKISFMLLTTVILNVFTTIDQNTLPFRRRREDTFCGASFSSH